MLARRLPHAHSLSIFASGARGRFLRSSAQPVFRSEGQQGPPPPSCRGRLVLLDRDGVINADVGPPGVTSVSAFRLIPGAAAAIAKLKVAGAAVCLVTNQTCVGRGLLSEEGLGAIHDRMRELLVDEGGAASVVDAIYYATRTADTPCDRRKPAPGMLLEAIEAFGGVAEQEALEVTMVGDTVTDMQAAAAAGVADRAMVFKSEIALGAGVSQAAALRASSSSSSSSSGGAGAGAGAGVKTLTPIFIDAPEDDPSDTLPAA